jgi:hypothetical protein
MDVDAEEAMGVMMNVTGTVTETAPVALRVTAPL